MNKEAKIIVIGHNDIIQKSLVGYLHDNGFTKVTSTGESSLDVLSQDQIEKFFHNIRPEFVFLASVRSGGIAANQRYAADFIYTNLSAQNNIIHLAYKSGVRKLLFYASSCIYPKDCSQPMKESNLLTGPLEETSEAYAIAKIAGIKMCQAYRKQYRFNAITMVPATVYGPGVGMDPDHSHVIEALVARFYQAVITNEREVVVWGSGKPKREFLFADDFVEASLYLMDRYEDMEIVNVGSGHEISIKDLAELIAKYAKFKGKITFNQTKPDGVKQKLLDSKRISKLGWKPKVELEEGIKRMCEWHEKVRRAL